MGEFRTCFCRIIVVLAVASLGVATSARQEPVSAAGGPAVSFRLAATMGETEIPFFRGAAHISRPWGLGTMDDDVLIADAEGRRVLRFSANGRFVSEIGRAGLSYDIHDEAVRWLSDVAAYKTKDAQGREVEDTFLADALGHYVLAISYSLGKIYVLGEPGVPGSDAGHFAFPAGLAVDPSGNLYVSDGAPPPDTCGSETGNHRVQVLDREGQVVATIGRTGVAGAANDLFDRPAHLYVDDEYRLYVADSGNHRVQVFDVKDPKSPAYVSTFGQSGAAGSSPDRLDGPLGVAADASFVYVADGNNCRLQVFRRLQGTLWETIGSPRGCQGDDDLGRPADVALDDQGNIYVADAARRQVEQYLPTRVYNASFGAVDTPYITDEDHYNHPSGVTVDEDGSIYIVEAAGHRLVKRRPDGEVAWTVGTPGVEGDGESSFYRPEDVDVSPDGVVYVADSRNHRIQAFGTDGAPLRTIGAKGTGQTEFDCPQGVAVSADGRLYVADTCNHRVQVLDAQGRHLDTLGVTGSPGATNERFHSPSDVAVDSLGRVYVADTANHRVQMFDEQLGFVATTGTTGAPGDEFHELNSPKRLAIDDHDRLYVADSGNNRVQVFASDGTYLTTVGGASGSRTGDLRDPRGIAVDGSGRLHIADYDNHRVQVLDQNTAPWSQGNVNGFGERHTEADWSLASYSGHLYAGTHEPERGASVWRLDDPGAADSWSEVASGGFGDPENVGVASLAEFDGRLYAATANLATTTDPTSGRETSTSSGAELWRSDDGSSWQIVVDAGFGNPLNSEITVLREFGGALLAGTRSLDDTHAAEVWRSDSGDPGSWVRVGNPGINRDLGNAAVTALGGHDGRLYAGTCNGATGAEVWVSEGGTRWSQVNEDGFGDRYTTCVWDLVEYDGRLYVLTGGDLDARSRDAAAQVWRCTDCDGEDWELESNDGFGEPNNKGRGSLAVFHEPPFTYLYAAVGNRTTGLEVWRASDGALWEQIGLAGFGDGANVELHGPASIAVHDDRLYVATVNHSHGAEVWSTAGARPGLSPTPGPGPSPTATPRPRPTPITGRTEYVPVDAWPHADAIAGDVIGEVADMAIADDGGLYLLDAELNRVLSLAPDGTWGPPFGNIGRGIDRIGRVGAIDIDSSAGRVYVADHASERLLVYGTDGEFLDVWPEVYATGIEVQADGRLWIADQMVGAVRLLEPDGTEVVRFGSFGGSGANQFRQLTDVTVSPSGTLFVADRDGTRIRLFREESSGYRRIRTLSLEDARKYAGCDGSRITWLGPDAERFMAGGCVINGSTREDVFPTHHRSSDLYGVQLWTANPRAGHYRALAEYDADLYNPQNETWPAVVQYLDDGFDIVVRHWRGRSFEDSAAAMGAISEPSRLSTAPDGSLLLTDAFGMRRLDYDGRLVADLPIVAYPSRCRLELEPDLAVGEGDGGRVMGVGSVNCYGGRYRLTWQQHVVYAETEYRRYCRAGYCEIQPYLKEIWSTTLPRETEGVAAVAHEPTVNQLVVLRRHHASPHTRGVENIIQILALYPLGSRGRREEIVLEGTDRDSIWEDVDATPEGRIYVLDTFNDRIQVLSATGDDLGLVPTPKDAYRVAGGPNGEMFVLTVYGHVVRLAPDGSVLSRFDARPHEGLHPMSIIDIAVDQHGWVYVVDEDAGQVAVFEPRGIEDNAMVGNTCSALGDKWVAPTDILLGDTAQVLLGILGSCGEIEVPSDIVVAVNTLGRTLGNDSGRQLANNLRVARQIAALADLDVHRLGIVAFAGDGVVETPLTDDTYQVVRALWSVNAGRATPRNYAALYAANGLFDPSNGRRRAVIVVKPGSTDAAAVSLANEMKASGTLIVVVNGDSVIASGDLYNEVEVEPRGAGAGKPAHRRMMETSSPDVLFKSGKLVDVLPPNMRYVLGSASPSATWSSTARTLTWDLAGLPFAPSRFSFVVEPLEEGLWPTNVEAHADYVDGWDHAGRLDFPVPKIRVYGELPPTATPTPTPTNTPEPTPTMRPPVPIYLPVALEIECTPRDRNADVALVIDTSGSMGDATRDGGPTKLEAARDAAAEFLGVLDFNRDQAALLQFNTDAKLLVALTSDRAALLAGLDALTQESGTRIDLALLAGRDALTGPERKEGNNAVLILLTDGKPTMVGQSEVLQASDSVHEAGILTFTIGLGPDVDHELLELVATIPEWYSYAPDTSDLQGIYERIAYSIPCPEVWP